MKNEKKFNLEKVDDGYVFTETTTQTMTQDELNQAYDNISQRLEATEKQATEFANHLTEESMKKVTESHTERVNTQLTNLEESKKVFGNLKGLFAEHYVETEKVEETKE